MNKVKSDFLFNLLAELPVGVLLAGIFFALLGVYYSKLVFAAKRDQNKPGTPDKWDWRYFIKDNLIPFLKSSSLVLITIFISIRFVEQFTGSGLTMIYCFFVGLSLDEAINRIKNYKNK